ncbi:MAG: hypothetical protein Q8N37_04015 [bacterium]|nr:hypothetical protein [bacterium]
MELFTRLFIKKETILALGAESVGIFAVYRNGDIFVSENFGDLLDEKNFLKYKKAVLFYLKKERFKPDVILTDLHPLFKTTIFGEDLALRLGSGQAQKRYLLLSKKNTKLIKVQHHFAHIFSAVGDYFCHPEFISGSENYRFRNKFGMTESYKIPNTFFGIAMDGTGYGLDGNIWGGEVFEITNYKLQITKQFQNQNFKTNTGKLNLNIERIGSLEEQTMIGGDLAVKEPARMLIAILAKITNYKLQITNKSQITNLKKQKDFIYKYVKNFYTRNEFEALYSQSKQDFNCQKTTSTGRILDAVAVLLGFAGNERKFKHEAVKKLEENSSIPYFLKPIITFSVIASSLPAGDERGNLSACLRNKSRPPRLGEAGIREGLLRRSDDYIGTPRNDKRWILQTTPLFKYLIKNIHKDKKRLAATAQLYVARGLYEIIKKNHKSLIINHKSGFFAAGGMANNKIISSYLEKQGVYIPKKIPRGDEGIAIGQIIYYLTNSRH